VASVENLNFLVGLGTLAIQGATLLLLVVFLLRKKSKSLMTLAGILRDTGLLIAFLLFLFSTGASLYYSDVLGFIPCGLCWLQRVFIFPQTVLFLIAIFKKDKGIAIYSIALSIFGAIVALYQHYLQVGGTSILPCPATVQAVECSKRILFEFGYITFPLVAFSVLAFAIVLMLFVRMPERE
jgi:disulfide bond formation protein DsbB